MRMELIRCKRERAGPARMISITVNPDILALFDKRMKERKEENRSGLIEYLMTCYVFTDDNGECLKDCPQYVEEKPDAK